jgi:LysM domain
LAVLIRILILLLFATALGAGGYFAVQELYVKPEQRLLADRHLPPPEPPPDPSIEEFARCAELRRTGTPKEARMGFERFLREFPESRQRDAALDAIGEINSAEFFGIAPDDSNTTIVQPGDSLGLIASRTKLPLEFIVQMNQLKRDVIHPGQRLLTPTCEFRVTLEQKTRRVVLTNGGRFFRQYPAVSWPDMHRKPVIFLPKTSGRVTDKRAVNEKGVVGQTDLAYFTAAHVIEVSIPKHSLFTQPDDPAAPAHRPPGGGGIGMAPAHMSEIAILLPKGAPVTLE